MILTHEQENKAVLSNVDAGAAFKITASAKAFSILSSGLYSDKIRAIVRELSCNAYDSHVAAGRKDVPFEVHLPTTLEPWFAVRDFGTGMSKEQVLDLYSTYFESTKTASNDFVGALGLGSKSPFSYTDNFSVTSTKDGKTGYFSAYINEQGFPAITCMAETPSATAAGVEVKFPVKSADFASFETAARRVLGTFAVEPKLNKQLQLNKPNIMRKHVVPGASLLSSHHYSTALIGNIEYPIDINMLSKDEHKKLLRAVGVYLEFNIGELDFQASREHLSYIPMTVNAIEKRLDELMGGFEEDVKKKLAGVTNAWQLVKLINECFTASPYSEPLKRYLAANHPDLANIISVEYGRVRAAFKITPNDLETPAVCNLAGANIVSLRRLSYRKANWRQTLGWSTTWDSKAPGGYRNYIEVSLISDPVIVVEDSSNVMARVKTHYLNHPNNTMVYIIRRPTKDAVIDVAAVRKLFMHPPTVVLSSTLPVPPREQKQRVTGKVKIAVLDVCNNSANSTWSAADNAAYGEGGDDFSKFDTNKTFYYLPLKGFEVITKVEHGYTVKEVAKALYGLHRIPMLGLDGVDRIYGVRKTDLPAVKASKNWINLEDHIKSKLTVLANDAKLQEQVAIRIFIDTHALSLRIGWMACLTNPDLKKKPLFARILEVYNECDGGANPKIAFRQFERIAGTNMFDSLRDLAEKVKEEIREKRKVYPLLDSVSSGASAMPHIIQYVNLIDEYNAKQTQPQTQP